MKITVKETTMTAARMTREETSRGERERITAVAGLPSGAAAAVSGCPGLDRFLGAMLGVS